MKKLAPFIPLFVIFLVFLWGYKGEEWVKGGETKAIDLTIAPTPGAALLGEKPPPSKPETRMPAGTRPQPSPSGDGQVHETTGPSQAEKTQHLREIGGDETVPEEPDPGVDAADSDQAESTDAAEPEEMNSADADTPDAEETPAEGDEEEKTPRKSP